MLTETQFVEFLFYFNDFAGPPYTFNARQGEAG